MHMSSSFFYRFLLHGSVLVFVTHDMDIGPDRENESDRSSIVKRGDIIDGGKGTDEIYPLFHGVDGSQGVFIGPDRHIGVECYNQNVPERSGFKQKVQMTRVENVKTTVYRHNCFPRFMDFFCTIGKSFKRHPFFFYKRQ